MDPLSRMVELVTVESTVSTRLEAAGTWALSFPGVRHVKLVAVHAGALWLQTGGEEHSLRAGDCLLLCTAQPYAVASAPGLEPEDGLPLFQATADGVVRLGAADEVVMTGGRFVLDPASARLLLDVLPPVLLLRGDDPLAAPLHATLALFAHETAAARPGGALAATHLARVAFVQALRAAAEGAPVRGWLAALADERIGAALHRMHADPARRWTVPELAAEVHLSRSGFADRFRALVGAPPLEHLLRVRMHVAGRELRETGATVSAVGAAAGYGSDAAFSNAFKRVMGVSPSAWRRQAVAT